MRTSTAIKFYGSQAALARALKVKQPSICNWGRDVPWMRQLDLELLTGGRLRHNPSSIPPSVRRWISARFGSPA